MITSRPIVIMSFIYLSLGPLVRAPSSRCCEKADRRRGDDQRDVVADANGRTCIPLRDKAYEVPVADAHVQFRLVTTECTMDDNSGERAGR
jgi:hypothetical protein